VRVEHKPTPGYHFTVDMTDQAIKWVSAQQALTPDKPFYMYFATGATHAPHHVPKEWIEKYKGQFNCGWDRLREETFAGFAEQTDHEVGRLVAQLEAIGELDNSIFFYIVGDNGASAEGGPEGTYNEMMALNGIVGKADQMMGHIDD
jgi:arylsulfatase